MAGENVELEADARTAVLVRRSDLPVPLAHPARSFFGGLPKMPSDFVWPRAGVTWDNEVEQVALTFIAQIDLSELPASDVSAVLPARGTLYVFSSSVFEGEGNPPCRILYHPGQADALPQAEPPPDLMVLAGRSDYRIKWLDPDRDFHSKVQFKYPLSFLPFRDFAFLEDPVGRKLLIRSLCQALGPGDPEKDDLLLRGTANALAADEDWPFNWLLLTYVARSVLVRTKSSYRAPFDDETRQTLQGFEIGAHEWLRLVSGRAALHDVDASTKAAFRAWWVQVMSAYTELRGRVWGYPHHFADDVRDAISHTIRHMSVYGDVTLAPSKYVANLQGRNRWTAPSADGGSRFFSSAIHQIGGYGSSWQAAPEAYREDVLLLQVQGDDAFLGWHENSGCVLHFWIGRDALAELDFSTTEATLECD